MSIESSMGGWHARAAAAAAAEAGGGCGRAQHRTVAHGGLAPRKGRGLAARLYSPLRSREISSWSRLRARARQCPLPPRRAPAQARRPPLRLYLSGKYAEGSHEHAQSHPGPTPPAAARQCACALAPWGGGGEKTRRRAHAHTRPLALRPFAASCRAGRAGPCVCAAAHLAKWRRLLTFGGDAGCIGNEPGIPC